MQWIELHNVEYGECIVLGGRRGEIFMVDCGSSNQKIREGEIPFTSYVDPALIRRYAGCAGKSFLLTHYHRDHLCGLFRILEKDGGYFDKIYLPVSPRDEKGRALLLEYALFVYAFRGRCAPAADGLETAEVAARSAYANVSVSALRIFSRTAALAGAERIYPVSAGRRFSFDGVTYEALWPGAEAYPFTDLFSGIVEDLNVCLSSPYLPECAREFLAYKEDFCRAYTDLCRDAPIRPEKLERLERILARLDAILPEVAVLPTAPDVVQILSGPAARESYTEELNAASVIFHNRRTREASFDDILMTGDATPESLDAVADKLYGGYYILKAPHHGTASHWNHVLGEISASHVLISNGDYEKAGKIAQEYVDMPSVKHCTNCAACAWYQSSGCSCNRVACCYEIPAGAGLTIKCPRCRLKSGKAPCGIYIISHSGERACLCDEQPARGEQEPAPAHGASLE